MTSHNMRNALRRAFHLARWKRFDSPPPDGETHCLADFLDSTIPMEEAVIGDFIDTEVGIAYMETLPLEGETE